MKKIILASCFLVLIIVILIIVILIIFGHGFVNYYNKPAGEVPAWFWLLFM